MTEQPLDLRRSTQIVWRHRLVVGLFAALGLAGGVGLTLYRPPMLSAQVLVDVVLPASEQGAAVQNGSASVNPFIETQIVIASSSPVLQNALRAVHSTMSLQMLQSRVEVSSVADSDVLSIRAESETAAGAEDTANAVAASYLAYSRSTQYTRVQTRVLERAVTVTGQSRSYRLAITGFLGVLLGALIGATAVLLSNHKDRRLRTRDEMADSIGVPVLASIRAAHPSGAKGWSRLLSGYQPSAVDAWRLRKILKHLDLAYSNVNGSGAGSHSSLEVLSFDFDTGALALGPQLAVFAASLGIPTALVVSTRQRHVKATAALQIACGAPSASSGRSNLLELIAGDLDGGGWPPDATLTVVVVVVDGHESRVPDMARTTTTVLGVSAGVATAEQVARIAASAAAVDRDITGILVANPHPDDSTTGGAPQLARSAHWRGPTRMAATTMGTRP
jgi:capsular polysaccharide biosynthesis protein